MITNIIDGKIYVGKHSTENLDDGYMGSGTLLQKAICKHGLENFRREIVQFFDSEEEAFEFERKIVTEDFVRDENTYNLREGGRGFSTNSSIIANKKLWSDPEFRKRHSERNIEKNKRLWSNPEFRKKIAKSVVDSKAWVGRKHSEETKRKIGEANSWTQGGFRNSQFGTIWITHPELKENKKIKKEDFELWSEQGWIKGRKF